MSDPEQYYTVTREPDPTVGSITESINSMINYARQCFAADDPMRTVYIKSSVLKMIERYDRHVRLVKLSRDITTECKNIITFLLHSPRTPEAMSEARERLQRVINGPMKTIGLENEDCPPILHDHAVTDGFQEYVKARIMICLLSEKRIIGYPEVQTELQYFINDVGRQKLLVTKIPRSDYLLGLAELSVELMRRAVNNVSGRNPAECFETNEILRHLYSGYLGTSGAGFLNPNLPVTQANLQQVEQALLELRKRNGAMRPYWMDGSRPRADIYEYRRKYYGY